MRARTGIRVTGGDREGFLQNLVTNDVGRLREGLVWTALLTPQGKYLADFFLVPEDDAILIDVDAELAAGLLQRLSLYKLRADVKLAAVELTVARGSGPVPDGAFADPRHPDLGWRAYDGREGDIADWDRRRIAHLVPESGIELVPNECYPLEMNFEALNGVDFRKGCYVGQEVTARMKHKTVMKKGLTRVRVSGTAPIGTEIGTEGGKSAGTLYSQSDGKALAFLRLDRANQMLVAGKVTVTQDNL
ncbi:MAG: folate-binding protein [Silicimonas sp.]|nr:folate-binding protein [Silicimonas sp.]